MSAYREPGERPDYPETPAPTQVDPGPRDMDMGLFLLFVLTVALVSGVGSCISSCLEGS